MLRPATPSRAHRLLILTMFILLALSLRTFRAIQEPIINPDAIRFIGQAQQLAVDPLNAIRSEIYHPLHSACSLAAHSMLKHFFADDRAAWLASVKAVGILAGSIVALQIILLARLLGAPFWHALAAACIFIVGRRTSAYGADGLSDMLCLALFAGSMITAFNALRSFSVPRFFLAGLLAGLAYLARPEGLAAVIIIGTTLLLPLFGVQPSGCHRRKRRLKPVLQTGLSLLLGAALPAIPYMLAIGSITRKETKFITNAHDPHGPAQAISLLAVPAKISKELWETFGFAPYLIVLITFLASAIVARRLWIRRRLRLPVLIWLVLWFAVMAVVARRLGYLDGRHTLILVLFLYPLLAVAFFAITQSLRYLLKSNAIPRLVTALVFLAAFLPGIILLRIPTRADKAFLRTAANWVAVNTSPDDVVYDYEQLVGYYAHRPYKQWLGTPSAPALESLPSIQETPYLLAYHYYPGETPQPNIGPYHAIATFHSTNGKETLILYALPIH